MKRPLLVVFTLLFTSLLWAADDGSSVFQSKCAKCHGPSGEGRVGTALKNEKMSEAEIVTLLTQGVDGRYLPHTKPLKNLSSDEAAAVAKFVKTLK